MDFIDYGIQISSSGTQIRTICPRCSPNRTKSKEKCLAVNTIEGCWFCHHCSWAGGLNEKEYKVFEHKKPSKYPDHILEYFTNRGISEQILIQENINFVNKYNKTWVTFPYFYNSVCVNIKYKTFNKDFMQEKGGKKCLYRIDEIKKSTKKTLVITEGEIDTLSVLMAGFEAASIPDGAPNPEAKNFTSKFDFLNNTEKIFDKFNKIIIAGDNDPPGYAMIKELGRRIGYEKCYVVKYPEGCKDVNDVLKTKGAHTLRDVLSKAYPFPVEGIIKPTDCTNDLLLEFEHGVDKGLSTGWSTLDELYTVRPGEMTIVTGIPGSGKSNFVDCLCVNLAMRHKWVFGMFSPENWPVKRHAKTLLEKVLGKSFDSVQYGERMYKDQIPEGMKLLDNHFRFILPKDDIISVDVILKYARILCLQYGIKGLVIDPWNEIEHDQKRGEREDQYISRQLTKIRRFSRMNGIHIWVIAHPTKLYKNNDGDYDPPTMYDISGGAQWRNKADNGICVFRNFEINSTTIFIQKIRFREIGKIGEMYLSYKYSGNYNQI